MADFKISLVNTIISALFPIIVFFSSQGIDMKKSLVKKLYKVKFVWILEYCLLSFLLAIILLVIHIANIDEMIIVFISFVTPYTVSGLNSYYEYNGEIKYKDMHEVPGGILATYKKDLGTEHTIFTVDASSGKKVLDVISIAISILTGLGVAKYLAKTLAQSIVSAIISYGLTEVVGGLITSDISPSFAADVTTYDMKVSFMVDGYEGETKYYTGYDAYVTDTLSEFLDETFYEGVYPDFIKEKDNSVAATLFFDFFATPYPGVDW